MDNEIVLGEASPHNLKVVGLDGYDLICELSLKLGKTLYNGNMRLIVADTYDIAVFYLLRDMFKMPFPEIGIITYMGFEYIALKTFNSRRLQEEDYSSKYAGTKEFRYLLAQLSYFCKLVGCPFYLRDVQVVNDGQKDIPILWRCKGLGIKNAPNLTPLEFLKIYNVSLNQLKEGHENDIGKALVKGFREVDFDTDVLRGILYLRDGEMRWAKGQKIRYKLSKRPREIENVIEVNYALLQSEYPFKIFK